MNSSRPSPVAFGIGASLCLIFIGSTSAVACLDDAPAGIADEATGATASAGKATGGKATGGGTSNEGGKVSPDEGGSGGTSSAGTSGSTGSGAAPSEGGAPTTADEGGAGGVHDRDGVRIPPTCTFHTDAPTEVDTGAGGQGPGPDVLVQLSPFVGRYLTDAAGRTLYTYGADLAGDCEHPPQSTCIDDCLIAWPIFHAGSRVLGEGLDDADFGVIEHQAGGLQTTYKGWPLYYYKTDVALGQMAGQGKGKIWHIAEVDLPQVTIMKAGMLRYLADESGHTLYVSADDRAGTADSDPVSNCEGACLQTFEPFHPQPFSVVTILETSAFEVFARNGTGSLQLAYNGMPLYRAATDVKSGDMNGTAITGFTAAAP